MSSNKSIAVIGGGAAGFFSAICAAQLAQQNGPDIRIFEASEQVLKKVRISGGGRCNVTHNCFDVKLFCKNYPRGSRELLSPMQRFQASDTVEWFKNAGVQLVAEADGRMFPDTNSSETIIDCFFNLIEKHKIKLITNCPVQAIEVVSPNRFKLTTGDKVSFDDKDCFMADAVLVATGSGSYPLAESLGHSITERAPSLFSFIIQDVLIAGLEGLSFKDTSLKLAFTEKTRREKVFKQRGPVLITHWGLSGPAILKLSAWAAREMKQSAYNGTLTINWMGAENSNDVESRLNRLKSENLKSHLKNVYPDNLPKRFWLNLLDKCSIDRDKQWAQISKKEVAQLCQALVASRLNISGQNRFKDEFVECGGVALREIDFKTMQSKICPGLYFAGEILDVDGITGGFNFQNAWTTAWVAAQHMMLSNSGTA
ncbi:MAG: NAD(P)/FAD-dependent oxidoreductase [Nitrospinae bacterium]|nr:NAD(P)/FAD-dependent oxidoreductase [Nitrospinota bacterium]